jgi:hypothetical protein
VYRDQFCVETGIGKVAGDHGKVIVACIDLGNHMLEIFFTGGARRNMDIRKESDTKTIAGTTSPRGLQDIE